MHMHVSPLHCFSISDTSDKHRFFYCIEPTRLEASVSDLNEVYEVSGAAVGGDFMKGLRVIRNVKHTNLASSLKQYRSQKEKKRKLKSAFLKKGRSKRW